MKVIKAGDAVFCSSLKSAQYYQCTKFLVHLNAQPSGYHRPSLDLIITLNKDDNLKIYVDIIRPSRDRINELVNEIIENHVDHDSPQTNLSLFHLFDKIVKMVRGSILLKNIVVYKEYVPKTSFWL